MIFIITAIKKGPADDTSTDFDAGADFDRGMNLGALRGAGGRDAVLDQIHHEGQLRMEISSKSAVASALDSMAIDPNNPRLSEEARSFVVELIPFIGRAQGIANARAEFSTGDPKKMERAMEDAVLEGIQTGFDATLVGGVTLTPAVKALRAIDTVCEIVPGGEKVAPMRAFARQLLKNPEAKNRVENALTLDLD